MAPRKKKAQISVYLDPATMGLLADYAARRDQPQSLVAEAAILPCCRRTRPSSGKPQ